MSQNSLRISLDREEVDERLQKIMKDIHDSCYRIRKGCGWILQLCKGANMPVS